MDINIEPRILMGAMGCITLIWLIREYLMARRMR